jgi:drug/metabolite transporter (DMT)-like permease
LLGSRVNTWTVAGSLFSSAGVAVTALLGSSGQMVTMMGGFQLGKGELFIAIAAIISAVTTIITQLHLRSISLGFFSIFRTAVGTVIFFILANLLYGSKHFAEAFSPFLWEWMFLYAAVIVVVGQLCWFSALKDTTLAESELGGACSPLIAIFMAYLILGEVPTLPQYLGGIIIMIGIVLSFIGNLRQIKIPMKPIQFSLLNAMKMAVGFKGI